MKFFNQIAVEIKNIFRSKFLLIISIMILSASIILPVFLVVRDAIREKKDSSNMGVVYDENIDISYAAGRTYVEHYSGNSDESITVGGITIHDDNPFYWNIRSMTEEKDHYEMDNVSFSSPQVLDMLLDLIDTELQYYLRFAVQINTYDDYRRDLVWGGNSIFYDKFIYEHYDPDTLDVLKEAISYRYDMDDESFDKKYVDISSEERLRALDEATDYLDTIYEVVESKDFAKYIDLRIEQSNDQIADLEAQIEIQEQNIIDNPSQEASINVHIEDLQKQITIIEANIIPILEYRLQENIIPGEDGWQNEALGELEQCRSQLAYNTIMTEEEFFVDQRMAEQYGTYTKYVAAIQAEIDDLNNRILVAQKCLDTGKPDMRFVPGGGRSITTNYLGYSSFIALFGVMLGGWIIASEFQQGTIRLLMIRPRTRLKMLMTKYLSALLLCVGIFVVGSFLFSIVLGICYGFGDYAYPNVTVSGSVNFFAYYLPRFLACLVPILFYFSLAFMFSVLIRNAAVSIAIPVFCYIGSNIGIAIAADQNLYNWVAWTPVPFLQIHQFFSPQNTHVQAMINRGVSISLPYGILLLLGLSAICVLTSMQVFKKRDITN